jgi:hypothetical protein
VTFVVHGVRVSPRTDRQPPVWTAGPPLDGRPSRRNCVHTALSEAMSSRGPPTLLAMTLWSVNGRAFETVHSDGKCGAAFQARFRVVPAGGAVAAGD